MVFDKYMIGDGRFIPSASVFFSNEIPDENTVKHKPQYFTRYQALPAGSPDPAVLLEVRNMNNS